MKNLKLFALMALVLVSVACGGGGGVAGPSAPGDSSARASMSVEIWSGGIPGCSGAACDGPLFKLSPNADGSYSAVQRDRKYGLVVKFNQPGVAGRRIQGDVIATQEIFRGQDRLSWVLNESSPARVIEFSGEFTVWGGSGATQVNLMLRFTESGPDMGSSTMSQDIVLKTIPRQG